MMKSISTRLAAVFLLASSAGSYAATVDDLPAIPGIPPAGSPAFVNTLKLKLSNFGDGYKLTATAVKNQPFLFQLGSDNYEITGGTYSLNAYFDQDSNLDTVRSNVQIRGTFSDAALEALSGTERQHELWGGNLFSARLDNVGLNLEDGNLAVGFATADFGGWASQFGNYESIWLFDFSPSANNVFGFLDGLYKGTLQASAVTTVPLPAGIWLMGSALIGFGLIGSRRNAISESKKLPFDTASA
ncbi:hypothetical protein sS8_5413 [Methylocaldum marinum]|uniref:Uncharacterized protein n=1 Tax=Methylocaldum marinum TaxID=1432792 RepID=A0A250L0B3_9GAMM|nr:VPLPA-CTERM sorting domain-containing protein [Methylocaldum marinum]BBA37330.1 hypothetical protein sS8_5413 [Methylocaldum marinum]